jgi:methylenetetrahydrofolate--tRNA-(uracil-5-)-methyltransferase
MHRNTYLDGPKVLLPTLQTRARPDVFVAGQLTGVEGYVESIGAGLVAGVNAARLVEGLEPVTLPPETMLGSLLTYVAGVRLRALGHNPSLAVQQLNGSTVRGLCPAARFQPMNANFGLLPELQTKARGREKKRLLAEQALEAAESFSRQIAVDCPQSPA